MTFTYKNICYNELFVQINELNVNDRLKIHIKRSRIKKS